MLSKYGLNHRLLSSTFEEGGELLDPTNYLRKFLIMLNEPIGRSGAERPTPKNQSVDWVLKIAISKKSKILRMITFHLDKGKILKSRYWRELVVVVELVGQSKLALKVESSSEHRPIKDNFRSLLESSFNH